MKRIHCNISPTKERDYKTFLHERDCNFLQTLNMASTDAFGANQTFNAERHAASIGSFGVTSVQESYTSSVDDSPGVNIPDDHEPIYVNR